MSVTTTTETPLDSRRLTRSRVVSERWSSTMAHRRRRRPRCCTTISTSSTGSRRSWVRCRAHRSRPYAAATCSIGVEDNSFAFFPELMDSTSVFLTANCDTVYFWGFVDLSDGPMVIDVPSIDAPSGILGTIDDMWFRWVTDVGLPGPDRGAGRPVSHGGARLRRPAARQRLPRLARSHDARDRDRPGVHGRQRSEDPGRSDPQRLPRLSLRARVRTAPRSARSSPATRRWARSLRCRRRASSRRRASRSTPSSRTTSGSGSWWTSWCSRNRRTRAIRSCSACSPPSGSCTASRSSPTRGCARSSRRRSWSATPPPAPSRSRHDPRKASPSTRTRRGRARCSSVATSSSTRRRRSPPTAPVAAPSDGARKLNSRTNFFYMATGITPAMCMRLTGIGSQYIYAMRDSEGEYFDGARNYRLTLPPDIPESRFWSVMLYDRQTRSMLQTDQHLPRLGSQSGTVETNPDGSTDIYFGPTAPERQGDQLAPDRPRQGLVDDPPALQPAPAVLRQDLAARARSSP